MSRESFPTVIASHPNGVQVFLGRPPKTVKFRHWLVIPHAIFDKAWASVTNKEEEFPEWLRGSGETRGSVYTKLREAGRGGVVTAHTEEEALALAKALSKIDVAA